MVVLVPEVVVQDVRGELQVRQHPAAVVVAVQAQGLRRLGLSKCDFNRMTYLSLKHQIRFFITC